MAPLRPPSAVLFGLALCVFLWGFGYKLSLYHPHPASSSRMPAAKLWLETGTDRNMQLPARAHACAVPHVDAIQPDRLPLRDLGRAALPAADCSPGPVFQALLPSRAPPAPALPGTLLG